MSESDDRVTRMVVRVDPRRAVALETTLLVHGVPPEFAEGLHRELEQIVSAQDALPALIGLVCGVPTVGLEGEELRTMLNQGNSIAKVNSANLGVLVHWGAHGATTVSATMEIAWRAGIRVFATGGLGGVHRDYGCRLDVSSDLAAFTRFPVCVVSSGVKGLLDVEATREVLETLGVTVVGYRTDEFPAFYQRSSGALVDARMDDVDELAGFVRHELARTGRGVLVCQAISEDEEIPSDEFEEWLERAEEEAEGSGVVGRGVTPFVLGRLHELSGGRTLQANLELVKANARLAGLIASRF